MIGYIYQIENLVTHQSYIGQTVDYNRRIKAHINQLRRNVHENPKLQSAWNKYGEQEFHFRAWEFKIESEQELDRLECEYIEKYNSLNDGYNLVPGGNKPPNRQKVKDEDIINFLCVVWKYGDGFGKTFESIHGWAKGTASAAKRRVRFFKANEIFTKLTDDEKEKIATQTFEELDIKQKALERQLTQGGNKKAYSLTQDDYNFAFCANELGYTAPMVAKYLGVKDCTIYDWFNGRSRKKEYNIYRTLSTQEKERLVGRVKTAELSGNPKSSAST